MMTMKDLNGSEGGRSDGDDIRSPRVPMDTEQSSYEDVPPPPDAMEERGTVNLIYSDS